MEVLPSFERSPASAVTLAKCPCPSLRKQALGPPIEVTSKSKSPSPSMSAKTAPVDVWFGQATPASAVVLLKLQPPRLRYRALVPLRLQRYMSIKPSPS